MKRILSAIFLLGSMLSAKSQNSVLAEGDWYKLSIHESGIYKIDRQFLEELGIDPDQVDPRTLKIFGNGGGGELPRNIDDYRIRDLKENPTFKSGSSDGSFDNGDYILFYGNDPHYLSWEEDTWSFHQNIYTDSTFYFLTFGGSEGLNIPDTEDLGHDHDHLDFHREVHTHDINERNILQSGKQWFGESLRASARGMTFQFTTPDLTDSVFADVSMMVQSTEATSILVEYNGDLLGSKAVSSIRDAEEDPYSVKGYNVRGDYGSIGDPAMSNLTVALDVPSGNPTTYAGYIDRIVFSYNRSLNFDGETKSFTNPASYEEKPWTFEMSSASEPLIWDITDPTSVGNQPYQKSGSIITFGFQGAPGKKFIVFTGQNHPYPGIIGKIANQNIRSKSPRDGVIITHPLFLTAANRLASFHEMNDGLEVEVITTNAIFNEFAGGSPDLTGMRDAIRHMWMKNPETFKYVLLFGDCSYDYKDRIPNNTNLVPIYESDNSLDPVATYSSDDYFGFLEDGEGLWSEGPEVVNHTLDVGVGRLPVKTLEEAQSMVNKIIRYSRETDIGQWKNNVTYVVDDGDNNRHVIDAELLSYYFDQNVGQLSLNKLYIDVFDQQGTGSSQQSPQMRDALETSLEEGTFLVNYIGHGNEAKWADEDVFDHLLIDELKNLSRLPVFVTATCEFGRYDDPVILTPGANFISGAEKLILKENGGAIALLTTTRPVFAFSNYLVNDAFHKYIFDRSLHLGDIIRLTKNDSFSGVRNRNFSLLGDPMLRLNYPDAQVEIKELNGLSFSGELPDTLHPLQEVRMTGEIVQDGLIDTDFNGTVEIVLFDRPGYKSTQGQESSPISYQVRENRLFRGKASVKEGEFVAQFTLPKDINEVLDYGKFTFYALDEDSEKEATGFDQSILVGGTQVGPVLDNTSPSVTIYYNDSTFDQSKNLGNSILLIANLSDDTGIDASGLNEDHNITLTLNDTLIFKLNEYYTARLDDSRSGTLVFPLTLESGGRYSGSLKVSDLHNNQTVKGVDFIVSGSLGINLYDVTNYPNPASDFSAFRFKHDRIGEGLEVGIKIFDHKGSEVINEDFDVNNSQVDVDGLEIPLPPGKPGNGLYFYKLKVRSRRDGAIGMATGKIIIAK